MPISPRAILLALAAAAATSAAACSAGNPQACTVVCSELGQCPDGTSCGVDGYCHTSDESANSCASETPDGSIPVRPDGSLVDDPDGSVVIVPDGSVDPPPDASVGPDACAGDETFAEVDLGPYLIPDDDPLGILLAIDVAGMCAPVQSVEVSVDVTHTYRGDIGMSLTAPSGDSIVLFTPDGADSADDINEVLQLELAIGEDANGTWLLETFDTASPDQGTLDRWSLGINRAAP